MRTIVALALTLAAACALAGCSAPLRATPADLDALTGPAWTGTLTYLDFTTRKPTSIPTTLAVTRAADDPPAWDLRVGYPQEPHADSARRVALMEGGRRLDTETVVAREALPGGGVRLVTEEDGTDNNRPARLRYELLITPGEYSRRKLVRYRGEPEFFERHTYRWSR